MYSVRALKHLIGWLILGTRGGVTRAQIIQALKETPLNANQLATLLKKDYRTIRHHLDLLLKNKLIDSAGDKYGASYFLSQQLEENYTLFEEITSESIIKISEVSKETYPEAIKKILKTSINLGEDKGISRQNILEIIGLCYECALKEEEGRPTSTSFIIGDEKKILKALPRTISMVLPTKTMRDSYTYLRLLFGVVDGYSSSFIIDKKGKLIDVGLLLPSPKRRIPPSTLIGSRYRTYANITKTIEDSLAFFTFGKLRVIKLFGEGSLLAEAVFSWKEGKWGFRDFPKVVDVFKDLASEKKIKFDVLCKCFSLAVEMSNRRLGGSFIIGDHKAVLLQSEKPLLYFEKENILNFEGEEEEYIINMVSKEFATAIDAVGGIVASSIRLLAQPPEDISVEVDSKDGGRHRSAAEMSIVAPMSVAIVISEDGPITIYSRGKRIIRI